MRVCPSIQTPHAFLRGGLRRHLSTGLVAILGRLPADGAYRRAPFPLMLRWLLRELSLRLLVIAIANINEPTDPTILSAGR
jgi:hypothetical protein